MDTNDFEHIKFNVGIHDWTVPLNVEEIDAIIIGGGGSGGCNKNDGSDGNKSSIAYTLFEKDTNRYVIDYEFVFALGGNGGHRKEDDFHKYKNCGKGGIGNLKNGNPGQDYIRGIGANGGDTGGNSKYSGKGGTIRCEEDIFKNIVPASNYGAGGAGLGGGGGSSGYSTLRNFPIKSNSVLKIYVGGGGLSTIPELNGAPGIVVIFWKNKLKKN
ncbi:MAG: hypothetical protein Satyrvirus38_3 [Satyrvirus sp.]|uniref:PE-PGRS protein n=1 Tax=Satyrvirus sp. TaxID=2487771 RepID=A0A3G5AEW7_9VIRU|nr:MAG: hypothetical protein Satyrvirus38_3 [Satyrvirus sp.]